MKYKFESLLKHALSHLISINFFIVFVFTLFVLSQKGAAQVTQGQQAKIDSLFSQWKSDSTPGMELVIISKGKKIVDRSYGLADIASKSPNNSDRKFWVASMSKQFTGLAIALLIAQKEISLDDDVRKYLPELPWLGDTIKIRHLIYHNSGLRDGFVLTAMSFKGEEEYTNANVLKYLSMQTGRNFKPGDRFEYNNSGYVLLAIIVERVSKMSFPDFVQQYIFKPLGMNDSRFVFAYPRGETGMATGYSANTENNQTIYQQAYFKGQTYGSTGLITTANDLVKWDRVFYEPVFGKKVEQLQIQTGILNDGQSIPYAFGLEIEPYKHKQAITHSGVDAGYKSEILRFPSESFTVICLANTDNAYNLTNKLFQIAELFIHFEGSVVRNDKSVCHPEAGAYIDMVSMASMRYLTIKDGIALAASEKGYSQPMIAAGNCNFTVKENLTDRYQFKGKKLLYWTRAEAQWFQSVHSLKPEAEELKGLAGAWFCPELSTTYNFFEKEGTLYIKFFDAYDVPLTSYEGNLYAAEFIGTNLIHFEKDKSGNNIKMEFNREGIHNLRFIHR